ncbi:UNVERIFIED_CONTAM: hypothetical protein RMT77_000411 [Armadillidium vulgare]
MDVYEILKDLGNGSYGRTFLAVKQKLKCVIQVTKLQNNGLFCSYYGSKILNLQHNNVTMFHDSFITGSSFCIVSEYCSGGNLKDFICRQNGIFLPEGFILDCFVQLGLAINFLHEKNIVHRNINSRSVFFSHDGCVKLGNFKYAALLSKFNTLSESSINITNYASPELIQKKPYDMASDIWSLGCVLYEMTCLKHAFEDSNEASLMLKILSSPVEPIPNHYSNDLKALTSLMLEKKSNKRPLIKTLLMFSLLNKRVLKYAKEEEIQDLKIDIKGNVGKLSVLKTNILKSPLSKYSKSINSLHPVPNISKEKGKKEKENDSVETLNTLTSTKYSKENSYIFKESARRGRKKSENIKMNNSLSDSEALLPQRRNHLNSITTYRNSLESPLLCRPLGKYSKILSNNFTSNEDSITFPRIIPPVTNSYSQKFLKDIFSPLASFSYIPNVNKNNLKCFKDCMSTMSLHKMRKDLDVLSEISVERLFSFYFDLGTIENIFTGFKMAESIFDDIYKRKKIIPLSFWTEGKNEISEEINGLLSYSKGPYILPHYMSLFFNDHYHMFNEGASKSSDIFTELFMLVQNCLCCTCFNNLLMKPFFSYWFFKHKAVDVNRFDQNKYNNKYLNVDLLPKYLQSKVCFQQTSPRTFLKFLGKNFQNTRNFENQIFTTTKTILLPANITNIKFLEMKEKILESKNMKFSTTITIIPNGFKSTLSFPSNKFECFSLYLPFLKEVRISSEEMHISWC